jgi:tripartite-type tricarboxylate transporter receptor subunit TctC
MKRLLAALFAALSFTCAWADTYPSRPLQMIIPWPPGGYADNLGRLVALGLGNELRQSVIVENRGGSNGLIGAAAAARATPDGYTVMFHSVTSHVINPALYGKVPYGPDDLVAVSVVAAAPLLLVATKAFPANNVADMLKLARAQADKPLQVASFGAGSASHLAIELLQQQAAVPLLHVPYRGGGPAMVDTASGMVPLYFAAFGVGRPMVAQGLVKPLAVTGRTRVKSLPDVPTLAEAASLPDFEMTVSYALWVPAHVPADVQQRLAQALARVVATPEFQEKLAMEGASGPVAATPAASAVFVKAETRRLETLVRSAGIKLD